MLRRLGSLSLPMLLCVFALACPGTSPDAGAPDGGSDDAGHDPDAGLRPDGGTDAGLDAGPPDASAPADAGGADASITDAGLTDGGLRDTAAVEACPSLNTWPSADIPEEYQRLVFADAERAVIVYRTYAGQGAGFTAVYEAGGFGLDDGTDVFCVTDPGDLFYEWSHHNWADYAEADIDGLTWHQGITFQPEGDPVTSDWVWTFTLTALDADGNVVEGPHDLQHVSGML